MEDDRPLPASGVALHPAPGSPGHALRVVTLAGVEGHFEYVADLTDDVDLGFLLDPDFRHEVLLAPLVELEALVETLEHVARMLGVSLVVERPCAILNGRPTDQAGHACVRDQVAQAVDVLGRVLIVGPVDELVVDLTHAHRQAVSLFRRDDLVDRLDQFLGSPSELLVLIFPIHAHGCGPSGSYPHRAGSSRP